MVKATAEVVETNAPINEGNGPITATRREGGRAEIDIQVDILFEAVGVV